jgi:hypothetical protein
MCGFLTTAVLSLSFSQKSFLGFIAAVGTRKLVPYYKSGGASYRSVM